MRAIKKHLLLIFLLFIGFGAEAYSQFKRAGSFDWASGLSVIPKGGVNFFYGDRVDQSRASYSFGVTLDREMTGLFSVRASLVGGQMKGEQIYPELNTPYATFTNTYADFMIGGTYRPLNHILGYFKERTFQPYVLAQFGVVYFNSTELWGPASESTSGADPGEEWRSASGISPVISGGGGINIWINPDFSANIEFHGALPFTDKLDAHDTWQDSYPTGNIHTTEPYDVYYTLTVGVVYTINESSFRNDSRFNRQSYNKTRRYYQPSRRKAVKRRPNNRNKKRFLFF
jgi:hypothetical protein